jgi:hypothetical protein
VVVVVEDKAAYQRDAFCGVWFISSHT